MRATTTGRVRLKLGDVSREAGAEKSHCARHVCGGSAYGRRMFSTAALPNPSDPGFVALGGVMGTLVGETIARVLRYDDDKRMRVVIDGGYYGTGFALLLYVAANAREVVS
jgi:hypothetical protein